MRGGTGCAGEGGWISLGWGQGVSDGINWQLVSGGVTPPRERVPKRLGRVDLGWGGLGAWGVGPVQMEGQDRDGFMSPECQTPVLGGVCYPSHPLGCLCTPLVLYQGGAPSPPTCCSLLCLPCRSEFTDTILSVHPSDVLDMPVDPNEPTYCLCHQVSYGEMIGCDNPDVSVGAGHRPWAGPCSPGGGGGWGLLSLVSSPQSAES